MGKISETVPITKNTNNHPRAYKILAVLFVGLIFLRILLYVLGVTIFHAPGVSAIFLSHDGREYLEFASLLISGNTDTLPPHIQRHQPGFPGSIALVHLLSFKTLSLLTSACLLQIAALAACVALFFKLCLHFGSTARHALLLTFTSAACYPTILYYGLFNLTESLFMAISLGSFLLAAKSRFLPAIMLASLAATVRSTGLLLPAALLLAHPAFHSLLQRKANRPVATLARLAMLTALALLPWVAMQFYLGARFQTSFQTIQPVFGLPFSGFAGIKEVGTIRAAYILAAVAFFLVTTAALITGIIRRTFPASHIMFATFSVLFLAFHLCLKTLYYIDHTVYTFDYQDRYLAPLFPIAVLVWQRHIRLPVVALLTLASFAISAYWLRNYLAVAL